LQSVNAPSSFNDSCCRVFIERSSQLHMASKSENRNRLFIRLFINSSNMSQSKRHLLLSKRVGPFVFVVLLILAVNRSAMLESDGLNFKFVVRKSSNRTMSVATKEPRILVAYSAPTRIPTNLSDDSKGELYIRNFDYFLDHGIDCTSQDTVIVLTDVVLDHYRSRLQALDEQCQLNHHRVFVHVRQDKCWDMESVRQIFYEFDKVNLTKLDYFVYVNCGLSGPSNTANWTRHFTSLLTDKVKMAGLTINCQTFGPHVQSMLFALDAVGLQIIRDAKSAFDCEGKHLNAMGIAKYYEAGMSQAIFSQGYGIASFMMPIVILNQSEGCSRGDLWRSGRLKRAFGRRIPTLNETLFFKTSRLIPEEIAREINYTGATIWS
jgi:hypothetical protein